jgi:hypothetical protein
MTRAKDGGSVIHRHLAVREGTPVEKLPLAAVHDLLDRGDLEDWRPLLCAIERDPSGEVASRVARLVDAYPMYGTSPLFRSWIERCRNRALGEYGNREPATLARVRREHGRTQAEVARRMGITQSDYSKLERRADLRLSTLVAVARALGGRLRLVIDFPDRDREIRLPRPPGGRSGPRHGRNKTC